MLTKIVSGKNKNMNKIKDFFGNIRRHKILFSLLLILSYLCYRMFISNYMLVNPIVKKDNFIPQVQLQNDLAICNENLDQETKDKQAAVEAANPDLFTNK